jgi:hypothetical protein
MTVSRIPNRSLLSLAAVAVASIGATFFAAPAQAGIFDAPSASEVKSEQERCYRSKLCRALIDERPPVVLGAVNGEPQCAQNANVAAESLLAAGHEVKIVEVRLPKWRSGNASPDQRLHAFAAARVDGQWWAVDNGALPSCGRACKLSDALAGVEKVGESEPVAARAMLERSRALSQNAP